MIVNLENKQIKISNGAWLVAVFFFIVMIFPFYEGNPMTKIWAVTFLSFFFGISSIIVAIMYRMRSNKFKKLLSGEKTLAQWTLTVFEKQKYVAYMFENRKKKNKFNFMLISIFMVVIFGFFIIMMDDDERMVMVYILIGYLSLFGIFAYFMPYYFRNKNLKGDGNVLIGKEFAYINGFFHNWDFLLSGIEQLEVIHEPFYGLHLVYYYTTRSLRNTEEIDIPAPLDYDLKPLIEQLT
jgi:uncharacterized membrane protein HdeD (DUF308 family)